MTIDINKIKFNAEQIDTKDCPWDDNYNRPHWVLRFGYDKRRALFDFWNNIMNDTPKKNDCLACILGDAYAGMLSFEDFCGDFGYDVDSRKAEKAWKACQKTYNKISKFFNEHTNEEIIELYNTINSI